MISEEKFNQVSQYLVQADRVFRKLQDKKILSNQRKKDIKKKLELLNHYVLLNNPKVNNKSLRSENLLSFLRYLENLNRSAKGISNV